MMPVRWLTNRSRRRCSALRVELIGSLYLHDIQRWTPHRFGNRVRITQVILLSLLVGSHVLGGERVFAIPITANRGVLVLRYGVLLIFLAPLPASIANGVGARPTTIPLADIP
jgi:hypothetical protein